MVQYNELTDVYRFLKMDELRVFSSRKQNSDKLSDNGKKVALLEYNFLIDKELSEHQ